MEHPARVGALILRDRKIILVSEGGAFWTPGGRMEQGEDHEQCLRRELAEELGITLSTMRHYHSGEFSRLAGGRQTMHFYLAEYRGEPRPGNEIKTVRWFSGSELKTVQTTHALAHIIPQLIADRLLDP